MKFIIIPLFILPVTGWYNAPQANEQIAETAITDGASTDGVNVANRSSAVVLENWTRFTLIKSQFQIINGTVTSPASEVLPARRELAIQLDSMKTSGLVSWLVETLNERFALVWEVSETWNTSWLAFGLYPKDDIGLTQSDESFMQLKSILNHTSVHTSCDEDFIKTIREQESNISLTLSIPKNNHSQPFLAKLKVVPSRYEDLAQPILVALDKVAPAANSSEWKMEIGGCYGPACVQFQFDSSGGAARTLQPILFVPRWDLAVTMLVLALHVIFVQDFLHLALIV